MRKLLIIVGMVALLMIILFIRSNFATAQQREPNLYLYTERSDDILKTIKPLANDPKTKQAYQTGDSANEWHTIASFYIQNLEKSINISGDVNFEVYLRNDDNNDLTSANVEIRVCFLDKDGNELANGTDEQDVGDDAKKFSGSMSVENFNVKENEIFGMNVSYRYQPGGLVQNLEMLYEARNYDSCITIPCNNYISIEVQANDHPSDENVDITGIIEDAFGSEDIRDEEYSIAISGNVIESEMSDDHRTVTANWDYSEEESGTYTAVVRIKDQNEYYWEGSLEFKVSKGEANVVLECSEHLKDVEPGYIVKYTVTVKNEGNRKDTIVLKAVEKPNGWDVTFEKDMVTLDVGEQQDVYVEIDVPSGTRRIDDKGIVIKYTTIIQGTSTLDNSVFDTLKLKTEVNPVYDIGLDCKQLKKSLAPGDSVEFEFTVKNLGNDDDEVIIEKSLTTWACSFSEDEFKLKYGEWANFTLTVDAPHTAIEGEKNQVTVSARSRGNPQKVSFKTIIAEIQYNIIIKSNTRTLTIKQHDSKKITLTIENKGSKEITISLDVQNEYLEWVNFETDTITVNRESFEEVVVKIDVPSDADKGIHIIKIFGKENDITATQILEIKIKVEEKDEGIESYYLIPLIASALIIGIAIVFISRGRGYEEEEEIEERKDEERKKEKEEEKAPKKEARKRESIPVQKQIIKPKPPIPKQPPIQPFRAQRYAPPIPQQPLSTYPISQRPTFAPPQKKIPTKIKGVGITQQPHFPTRPPSKPIYPQKPQFPIVSGKISPQMSPPVPPPIKVPAIEEKPKKKKFGRKEKKEGKKKKKVKKKEKVKTPISVVEEEYTVGEEEIAVVEEGVEVVEEGVEVVEEEEEEEEEVYAVVEEE